MLVNSNEKNPCSIKIEHELFDLFGTDYCYRCLVESLSDPELMECMTAANYGIHSQAMQQIITYLSSNEVTDISLFSVSECKTYTPPDKCSNTSVEDILIQSCKKQN